MEIEISEKNTNIIFSVLSKTIEVLKNISVSITGKETDFKKLTLCDLLYRQFPNLNSINSLLTQYLTQKNLGNTLPIGLMIRCSLEDMMFARYLLSFMDVPDIFENEIIVQSKNSISEYLQYIVNNESEHWLLPEEEKEKFKSLTNTQYLTFKKNNSVFFDEQWNVKNFKELRIDIPNIENYFDSISILKHGPASMFTRIKTVDLSFSYIYFEYKFYCQFEHYSFHTRRIMELNGYTFAHLALSLEFVLRGIIYIIDYLSLDEKHISELIIIKKSLGDLLKKE